MNCSSARERRASAPFSTTKRAPESFAAASKSISPRASPISKCSFGVNPAEIPNLPFDDVPAAAHLDIVVLVLAVGDIVERQVGDFGERRVERGGRLTLGRL